MWAIIGSGIKQILLKISDLCRQPFVVKKYKVLNSLVCQLIPIKEDEQLGRGYYHGAAAYPPYGFGFDPLLVLAALAFLALLLQTFHSFFYRTHMHGGLPLPNNNLPRTNANHMDQLINFVSSALRKYENLSVQQEPENRNSEPTSLISMLLPTIESLINKSKNS